MAATTAGKTEKRGGGVFPAVILELLSIISLSYLSKAALFFTVAWLGVVAR